MPVPEESITQKRIEAMLEPPRRWRLADWDSPLKAPGEFGDDWNLSLPFEETFVPAFEATCKVEHLPFRTGTRRQCYTFLKNVTRAQEESVKAWVEAISPHVAIRDCLHLSFALDYDREGSDPSKPQTRIGALRARAKPYDAAPTSDTRKAASALARECIAFIKKAKCYGRVDAVVAVPGSKPGKPFHLPGYLAEKVADALEIDDFSDHVRTIRERSQLKNIALGDKLGTVDGTVAVKKEVFGGREVLLIDDLYQSGVTMNYVGMMLQKAGARRVYGLACDKTCSNDDNISR